MGINCQINFFRPSSRFYHPGQDVSGVIKYAVDGLDSKEVFKIMASLNGVGKIILTDNPDILHETSYKATETYFNKDIIIQNKRMVIPVGLNEVKFTFILPPNIPSSMRFIKKFRNYQVQCYIEYSICIKFETVGLFSNYKHFRKEIYVMSPVIAKLIKQPAVYQEKRKLFLIGPSSKEDSLVIITATIRNSALPIGGKVIVHYGVTNKSHAKIEMINTKLIEAHTFKATGHHQVTDQEDVLSTKAEQVVSLNSGQTLYRSLEFNVPRHLYSLDNAVIVTRFYFIRITAILQKLHKEAVLDIPVQIGVFEQNTEQPTGAQMSNGVNYANPSPSVSYNNPLPSVPPRTSFDNPPPLVNFDDPPPTVDFDDPPPSVNFEDPPPSVSFDDPPPSYWEVMGEMKGNEDEETRTA